jgi:hypothetical protein
MRSAKSSGPAQGSLAFAVSADPRGHASALHLAGIVLVDTRDESQRILVDGSQETAPPRWSPDSMLACSVPVRTIDRHTKAC